MTLSFERCETARFGRRIVAPAIAHVAPHARSPAAEAAKRAWEDRARQEYVGVLVMRHLHGLLVDANAPLEIQEAALVFALDEQRHTRICIDAARSLGADGMLDFDIEQLQHRRRGDVHVELFDLLVALFLVSEVVALDLLLFSVRTLPPSSYRDALRTILRDEVAHARFGTTIMRELRGGARWLPYPGDDALAARIDDHVGRMRIRDVVHEDERALSDAAESRRELGGFGIPVAEDFVRVYHRSLDVSVPRALARATDAGSPSKGKS